MGKVVFAGVVLLLGLISYSALVRGGGFLPPALRSLGQRAVLPSPSGSPGSSWRSPPSVSSRPATWG